MPLRFTGSEIVHLDRHTFAWIQLTHFAFDKALDDPALLSALVAHDAYAHDYASPFDADLPVTEPAIHGRWWRTSIGQGSFQPVMAADAQSVLQAWADEQDWTDGGFRQPPEVQMRLQSVYALLRSGALYRLVNPCSDQEHAYGWVTGNMGYHEFVVFDRSSSTAYLVVASDD